MKNNWSINELNEAWMFAAKLHNGQKYGGQKQGEDIEYLSHIGSVVFEIMNLQNSIENFDANLALICAILHDTIEDSSITYKEIKNKFGEKVANGVMALTKNYEIINKNEKMKDSLERIKQQPKEIWIVKMADRISNLYIAPYYWDNEKKKAYKKESLLIYAELKNASIYMAERLKQRINDY